MYIKFNVDWASPQTRWEAHSTLLYCPPRWIFGPLCDEEEGEGTGQEENPPLTDEATAGFGGA